MKTCSKCGAERESGRCATCNKNYQIGYYRERHPLKVKKTSDQVMQARREKGKRFYNKRVAGKDDVNYIGVKSCSTCKTEKSRTDFDVRRVNADRLDNNCRVCSKKKDQAYWSRPDIAAKRKIQTLAYRTEIKQIVVNHYGGKCSCCSESQIKFLSVDHINGGGSKHRKEIGGGGLVICLWLIRNGFPDTFRILCHNCNLGRYLNGGICPHVSEIVSLVVK